MTPRPHRSPTTRMLAALAMAAAATWSSGAGAQAERPGQPDLAPPKQASELGSFSRVQMGLWKPKGDGPFPAVILVHSCAGIRDQIGFWRKEAIARGYVVLALDSFTSRGSPACNPLPPARPSRAVKDVYDAAEHLKTFAFVDKSRIGMIGMSWGGMVGLRAASPGFVRDSGLPGMPVKAIVNLYPACVLHPSGTFKGGEILPPDVSTPTLVLMGGRDTELPPQDCIGRLELQKARGAPVEWHVLPSATHCWDCSDQHNQTWSPPWAGGRTVVYLYDPKVTGESAERAFEFLSRRLRIGPTR